jgi:hypothetical protein
VIPPVAAVPQPLQSFLGRLTSGNGGEDARTHGLAVALFPAASPGKRRGSGRRGSSWSGSGVGCFG